MSDYEKIKEVILYINDNYKDQPNLETLANRAQLSPFHFQRLFKNFAGTTPKQFLQYLTSEHAKKLLRNSKSVLESSLEVGLSGPARLHDLIIKTEGMTPGEYKRKAHGLEITYGFHETVFGNTFMASTEKGICHFEFINQSQEESFNRFKSLWPKADLKQNQNDTKRIVQKIFSRQPGEIHLLLKGSDFQIKVWEALLKVPMGNIATYSDVASIINKPKSARATASAIAKNNIAILIPCHRIIRQTGDFGQYRWGSERKKIMLAYEFAQDNS